MFKGIFFIIEFLRDLPLCLLVIKWGYNPLEISIKELESLTDEQKNQMVKIAFPKTKIGLKKLFKMG